MKGQRLSWTALNDFHKEPHTLINYINGVPRYSNKYMESGKEAHRLIQDHVCGKNVNPLLSDLPQFPLVEEKERDERLKVELQINDDYYLIGYIDGLDKENKRFMEYKSGRRWTMGDFARLMQWRLYGLALGDYTDVYFINTPFDPSEWNPSTVNVYKTKFTEKDKDKAKRYLEESIQMIENIGELNLYPEKKSWWCNYQDCTFCLSSERG